MGAVKAPSSHLPDLIKPLIRCRWHKMQSSLGRCLVVTNPLLPPGLISPPGPHMMDLEGSSQLPLGSVNSRLEAQSSSRCSIRQISQAQAQARGSLRFWNYCLLLLTPPLFVFATFPSLPHLLTYHTILGLRLTWQIRLLRHPHIFYPLNLQSGVDFLWYSADLFDAPNAIDAAQIYARLCMLLLYHASVRLHGLVSKDSGKMQNDR